MIEKELCHNQLRSLFRKKPRFCSLFGSFYPHFANQLALRAAGASAQPAPVNLVGPQRAPGHCSAQASRPTLGGILPVTNGRFVKEQTGPISTNGPILSVCHRTRQFVRPSQSISPRSPP